VRLRFAGFGGQGVVLCGYIFGKAAMLDGLNAIHTQSYGSASRGGLTHSDVVISSGEIHDLLLEEFDLLVTLSQQSYDLFRKKLAPEGTLLFESDLVELAEDQTGRTLGLPATDIAFKKFGRKIIANMVMIGCVSAVATVVSEDALIRTISETVPRGTEDLNLKAFREGQSRARELSG
jgi:2-oxoglutarate ferredoxin oxidoreductase subunit gamma